MTATHTTFLLYAGDTWIIDAALHDTAGAALDLTGAAVDWRLRAGTAVKAALNLEDGITITDAAKGLCRITLPAARSVTLAEGNYRDETQVTLADGTVCTQAVGAIVVVKAGNPAPAIVIDPCATLVALQRARIQLLSGQQIVRLKIENVETQYAPVDLAALEGLIMKYDGLCSASKGGRPKRFAMKMGPGMGGGL